MPRVYTGVGKHADLLIYIQLVVVLAPGLVCADTQHAYTRSTRIRTRTQTWTRTRRIMG